jgi:hypothetical protein
VAVSRNIGRERFIALHNEQFPEVAAKIDDISEGLLHLEMATFSRETQAAIDAQDDETVKRHFRIIDEVFRGAAPDVENALNVSYLEDLRFDGWKAGPTQARELLPPRLHQALVDLEEYLAKLYERDGHT